MKEEMRQLLLRQIIDELEKLKGLIQKGNNSPPGDRTDEQFIPLTNSIEELNKKVDFIISQNKVKQKPNDFAFSKEEFFEEMHGAVKKAEYQNLVKTVTLIIFIVLSLFANCAYNNWILRETINGLQREISTSLQEIKNNQNSKPLKTTFYGNDHQHN